MNPRNGMSAPKLLPLDQTRLRGADLLVGVLRALDVDTIFSLSGNQIMPVYDACLDGGIRIVHTRHEAAAVFMADAWSQMTGRLGVAMVTAGPGLGNALGALYAARMADSAVLLLAGDSPLGQDGRGAFQALDQVAMTTPLTRLSLRSAGTATLLEELLALAHAAMSGRRGPVHFALPADMLEATIQVVPGSAELANRAASALRAEGPPDVGLVTAWIAKLGAARRPLIVTGPMLSPSRIGKRARELADACGAPVVCIDSSRGVRDPAQPNLGEILAASDCLLLLGRQPDFSTAFAGSGVCGRDVLLADDERCMIAAASVGDAVGASCAVGPVAMMDALITEGNSAVHESITHAQTGSDWAQRVSATLSARPVSRSGDPPFLRALDDLQVLLASLPDPILIIDGGEFGQWAQARLSTRHRIVNGMSGAIGGGPAYAIGAALASPSSPVLLLMGDGSAGFHLSEFETAVRVGAKFVAIVGNDHQWHAESLIQARDYGEHRRFGCELSPSTRYDLAVASLGGVGELVEDDNALLPAVLRALASSQVSCIDWRITPVPAPVYPPISFDP